MGRHRGLPMITTSVRISPEFHKLCIDNRLSFSEAIKRGVSLMLAELGVGEYDNNLNITRRCKELKLQLAESLQKLADLENGK